MSHMPIDVHAIPERVLLHAEGPCREGIAVGVRFHMKEKNDFNLIVFLDAEGRAEVDGGTLAREFAADRRTSPMDYADPGTAFTGVVTAVVLSPEAIDRALMAYDLYREGAAYPEGYEARLHRARGFAAAEDCRVSVRLTPAASWPPSREVC